MQNNVLAKTGDEGLRVYVAWVPMFRGREADVPRATAEVPDPRAAHYWDGDSLLVKGFRETLGLNEAAWDIFLLYGPKARWDGERPPAPRCSWSRPARCSRPPGPSAWIRTSSRAATSPRRAASPCCGRDAAMDRRVTRFRFSISTTGRTCSIRRAPLPA